MMKEMDQTELVIQSTMDGTLQPSLFFPMTGLAPRPLLVGLHTWSMDRYNQVEPMLPLAREMGWNLLLPEFRGPNLLTNTNCRQACGSLLARQDILDAVAEVKQLPCVDPDHIFLLGGSGGGHMALLMAASAPQLWQAVAAFVPITDLEKWFQESDGYRPHIQACCGGSPADGMRAEYQERSPINYIDEIAQSNLIIFHGKYDPVVPCHHSTDLYRQITDKHPDARVFLAIFDGGHEMRIAYAREWFVSQIAGQLTTAQRPELTK